MLWLRTRLVVYIFLLSQLVWAQHAAPVVTNDKSDYSGVQTDDWMKAQKDVQAAKIKYDNDQKALEDLKLAAKSQESLSKDSLVKISEAQKAVEKSKANYQQLLSQYNLRFPEKGLDVGRKYERTGVQHNGGASVDEKPQGIEAKLRRLNLNIKRQYLSNSNEQNQASPAKKKPKKKQSFDESKSKTDGAVDDDVTQKIIIEK